MGAMMNEMVRKRPRLDFCAAADIFHKDRIGVQVYSHVLLLDFPLLLLLLEGRVVGAGRRVRSLPGRRVRSLPSRGRIGCLIGRGRKGTERGGGGGGDGFVAPASGAR